MSKPLQLLRSQCRALQVRRRGQTAPAPPQEASFDQAKLQKSALWAEFFSQAGAHPVLFLLPGSWDERSRQAKLRLLAPALRRALQTAAEHAHAQETPGQHQLMLLQVSGSPLAQSRVLAKLLCACLSPADAPRFCVYWVVV